MKGVFDCEIVTQSEIAPGVVKALLANSEIAREAKAGQFVNIRVSTSSDPLLRRPFSIHATYPKEGLFTVLYVLVGRGTALLNKIDAGEKISVVGPLGNGFDLGSSSGDNHIVVAGGCGAAPLHFVCDALCSKWSCQNIEVLTGAKSKDAVLCEAEFKSHGAQVTISTDDGTYGHSGLVTELLDERLKNLDARKTRVYSCGPHQMMREVARICANHGTKSCQVSLENNMSCAFGVCMGCTQKIKGGKEIDSAGRNWHFERVCKDGPVFEAEDIIWD